MDTPFLRRFPFIQHIGVTPDDDPDKKLAGLPL